MPTSSSHKLKYIAVGIMILIVSIAGGIYFGRNLSKVPSVQNKQAASIPSQTSIPSLTIFPTIEPKDIGWKKYTNDKLGFSFEYHTAQMVVKECNFENSPLPIIHMDLPALHEKYNICKIQPSLTIEVLHEDFILDKTRYDSHQVVTKTIQIGSRPFLQYVGIRKNRTTSIDGMGVSAVSKFTYIPIKNNDKIFLISLEIIDPSSIIYQESLLNQILSTFEFVDNAKE